MPEYYDAPEADGLYATPAISGVPAQRWEALRAIYPALSPRQRQVVDLLTDGQTNQTAIAAIMGVPQSNVAALLKVIRSKIERAIV